MDTVAVVGRPQLYPVPLALRSIAAVMLWLCATLTGTILFVRLSVACLESDDSVDVINGNTWFGVFSSLELVYWHLGRHIRQHALIYGLGEFKPNG